MIKLAPTRTAADFGDRVREERKWQCMMQATLAAHAGFSIRWPSNFERGKSPRAELIKVVHVARALGLVFTLAEHTPPALSEAQQRILDAARNSLPSMTISSASADPAATTGGRINGDAVQAMLAAIGRGNATTQPDNRR